MMKIKTIQIDDDVADVLRRGTWAGSLFVLPAGQLDRKLYERVDKVLRALGGKWNRSQRGHIFGIDAKETMVQALDQGHVVDQKKTLEQFFTPADLASELHQLLDIRDGHRVLEPSAGNGRLVWEALERGAIVHAVEIDADLCEGLRHEVRERQKPGELIVHQIDFMDWGPTSQGGLFDRVIMNPPFSRGQDMRHVFKAFEHLAPGGQLVSIMSHHWSFAEDRESREFREFVHNEAALWRWIAVPPGKFRESGTMVATGILILEKRSA